MTYEDLSHHPTDNVKRLARFLGLDCSDEKIAEVVKSCSFDNMKKADAEFKEEFKGKRSKDGESAVFRKGQIYKTKQKIHVLPEKNAFAYINFCQTPCLKAQNIKLCRE